MTRIADDPSMRDAVADGTRIEQPILLIFRTDEGKQQFVIGYDADTALFHDTRAWGIVLSDAVDQIASGLAQLLKRDERDIREEILRTLRREEGFKAKDPSRGSQRGALIMPKAN